MLNDLAKLCMHWVAEYQIKISSVLDVKLLK